MGIGYRQAASAGKILTVLTGFGLAVPALADVESGVDSWVRGDFAAAVREWVGPAEAGDADAQFNLAQAFRLGRGVEADPRQAEALYAKAAAQGHLKAADNYGLLLFQDGRRAQAMPYIESAAQRGDPRAQYLLGIAHFNGDIVARDWPRAYALVTLADAVGLPQARAALAQMDEHIPLAEREAAQVLAAQIKASAEAARARDLAAQDLAARPKSPTASAPVPGVGAPQAAATRPAGLPGNAVVIAAIPTPAAPGPLATASVAPAPAKASAAPGGAASGPWKVQLGAFGVPGNADKLWGQLRSRAELAGHPRESRQSGRLTVLYATGFATQAEAQAACAKLKSSGQACVVTR